MTTTLATQKTSDFRTIVLDINGASLGEVRRLSRGTWHGRYINLYGADLALPHLPGDSEATALERVFDVLTYDEPGLYELDEVASF